jgi:hypothetical protein
MSSISLIDNQSTDDLDLSWIEEDTRMSKINQNYFRENMKYIYTYCIYINKGLNIDKIVSSVQELSILGQDDLSIPSPTAIYGISQTTLSEFIQTNQILPTGIKYNLLDILVYNVDLEPENIQNFSKTDSLGEFTSRFFKTYQQGKDIIILPSIFIFHNMNSIYFIFQEVDNENTKLLTAIKSNENSKKKTKRVSIHVKNHTRKYQITA